MFLICFFLNHLWTIQPISMIFASLINNNRTLRECLYSCRYKNLWDIGMYLKPHFYENCKQLRNPTTDFSLTYGEYSYIKERWYWRTSIYQTYSVFVPLFWKQILTKQNIASTKNYQEFLASQVPVLKRDRATNSSTSKHPFFRCNENPRI